MVKMMCKMVKMLCTMVKMVCEKKNITGGGEIAPPPHHLQPLNFNLLYKLQLQTVNFSLKTIKSITSPIPTGCFIKIEIQIDD